VTQFAGRSDQRVGTPAIDSSWLSDVYLTFDAISTGSAASSPQLPRRLPAGWVVLGVTVEPLVAWLWAGGLLAGIGGVLSLLPIRRRRRDPAVVPADVVVRELEAV
jgi:cytochrome c biogenesis factor